MSINRGMASHTYTNIYTTEYFTAIKINKIYIYQQRQNVKSQY